MQGIAKYHTTVFDSLKAAENRCDSNVQAEEVVVRFGHSKVEGVRERPSLRIGTVVLVPLHLLGRFSPSHMHPAESRDGRMA